MRLVLGSFAVASALAVVAVRAQEPPRPAFPDWLTGVRAEALARGIRPEVFDQAFNGIDEPLPVVIERDRSQAELVLPLEEYISRRLTPKVVKTAREQYAMHRTLLQRVSEHYGVPPPIIVAVWGIESNFGRFSGVRPTILALATLAYDPRRSSLFRNELFDSLEILNRGYIDLDHMRGSWAGAMGQVQFMPSSYLKYAEDFDGDGKRDIWSSQADIFASIANFLKGHGWSGTDGWGREVMLPAEAKEKLGDVAHRTGSCQATRDTTVAQSAADWNKIGVRTNAGAPLPENLSDASLLSGASRHFLVSTNYDALLEYNCANAYAVTVGLLADKLDAPPPARPRKSARR